jgi:hypothetical protein
MSKSSLVWSALGAAHVMPLKGIISPILCSSLTVPVTAQKLFARAAWGKYDQPKYLKEIPFGAIGVSVRGLSSEPSLQRIWFFLMDSAGNPYKGATPSSVKLPHDSVIDDIRDAVKAKYDQQNYLKETPSSALLVFESKAAFDKWKNGKDKVNHNHLMAERAAGRRFCDW